MSFSKITLISAALFLGAAPGALAASTNASAIPSNSSWTNNFQGDITLDQDLTIRIDAGDAYTLSGSFLSVNGSYLDSWIENNRIGPDDDTQTIIITGGGTLEYDGGAGSGYYSDSYKLTYGDSLLDNPDEIYAAWKGMDSFASAGNFTGTVIVSGTGTTLNLKGQLSQYVRLWLPLNRQIPGIVSADNYVGKNYFGASVTLMDGATLSFEQSELNLSNSALYQNPDATRVNALNFVKNLQSDASSKIVVGTDEGSHNRIVFYTDMNAFDVQTVYTSTVDPDTGLDISVSSGRVFSYTGETSTVGRLSGNGRMYFVGDGAVAFIGQSELNSGNDTTGNTWVSGNRLADILIDASDTYVGANIFGKTIDGEDGSATGNVYVYNDTTFEYEIDTANSVSVLTDSEALAVAVDNVFANATAVHFGVRSWITSTENTYSPGTNQVEVGATVVGAGSSSSTLKVNVYGEQVFNNFQSLCLERSNLLADADISEPLTSEAYWTSYNTDNYVIFSTGGDVSIRVGGGSVLTINQDAYRDGWFAGELVTRTASTSEDGVGICDGVEVGDNGDGLIVKTGAGKIVHRLSTSWGTLSSYVSRGSLTRLRIEEGTWATTPSGLSEATVEIVGTGTLELLIDSEKTAISTIVKGSGDLSLTRFTLMENDLTAASLSDLESGNVEDESDLEYRRYIINYMDSGAAGVQFTTEQTQFTGSVVVNDGLSLILGETGANSPSVFSSAESIILRGVNPEDERYAECDADHRDILGNYILQYYDGESLQYSTLEVLSGVQLVKNLIGEANYSAVRVEKGATLVLTRTLSGTSFDGGISGNGNLINLGGSQTVRVNSLGDLFGTLSVLSGSVTVAQSESNAGFSGLILANGGTARFSAGDGYAKIGMLVGSANTTVNASGDFTVGDMSSSSGLTGKQGEYLATANYGSYATYYSGTSLSSFFDNLSANANRARGTTGAYTTDSTLAYLKNPAQLIYTTDENVYDGAFSKLYATTGKITGRGDKNGDVFTRMIEGSESHGNNGTRVDFEGSTKTDTSDTLFRSGETVAQWLRETFKVEYITDFINSDSAQLSESMKNSLLAMAQTIASGDEGVCAYLDGSNPNTANLNTEGWNKLVAAGALEYLKAAYPDAGLDSMSDETLYSFITHFYPTNDDGSTQYEFVITDRNLDLIESTYGVNFGVNPSYETVRDTFGVDSAEFAGTLSGAMNLRKVGAETLRLTGVNTYTGSTIVDAGELYMDWNAAQYTSGIYVGENALLTISGEQDDIDAAHQDPDVPGRYLSDYDPGDPGDLFYSGSSARLSGSGVVMKIGDGRVDLGNALFGGGFTGTFLVGDGGLLATIDATETENPAFDVIVGDFEIEEEGSETPRKTTSSFELSFEEIVRSSAAAGAAEVVFDGAIEGVNGGGEFILDAGGSIYKPTDDEEIPLGNNTLTVAAEKFSPGTVKITSGNLRLHAAEETTVSTKNYELGSNAELHFSLDADVTITGADITGTTDYIEKLRVASETLTADGTAYVKHTLTLNDVAFADIDSIELVGGASLVIDAIDEENRDEVDESTPKIELSELNTGAETSLYLAEGRTIELTVAAGEKSVVGGSFTGEGTFIFEGADATATKSAGTLVLGNASAAASETTETGFSGTIGFESGIIELIAGENRTVNFSGLTINNGEVDATATNSRLLVKSGAGTVSISENNGNSIIVRNLSVDVREGTLEVGAQLFSVLPVSVNIEKGATFRFTDPLDSFRLDDLGILSGAGTLSFETSSGSATVSADGNIGSDFTGIVNVGANVTLNLGADVTVFSAFSGAGTVNVASGELTVVVNANEDGSDIFSGTLTGLRELTVVGEGALVLGTDNVPDELTTVTVGSETQNGGFGISASKEITIEAVGRKSLVILTDRGGSEDFSGEINVGGNVESLELLTGGTIALSETAVSDAFQLKTEDGESLLLDGSMAAPSVTLGNVAGENLTLKNLSELNAENFNLTTNQGGGIIFDGSSATGASLFAATFAASDSEDDALPIVWNKDITGSGGVTLTNGADITFTSSVLSYTGATVVESGSTLRYGAAGTVSDSSSLTVRSGATVVGGVSLVGEETNVTFYAGSTFEFNGNAIEFTGTGQVVAVGGDTKLNVNITAEAERGIPVALFRYIGSGDSGNKIEFSNLNISSEEGMRYLKESALAADTGATVIYVVAPDLANAGVTLHDGMSSELVKMLNAVTQTVDGELQTSVEYNGTEIALKTGVLNNKTLTAAGALAETIIKTPNGALSATLNNLSPLSYGAMLALPQSGFLNDIAAVSARIEQRRYDNYSQFIWETHNDWEYFVQAQGSFVESDEGKPDTRTFDMNTYGAIAGADVKLSATTVAGFAVAYDYGDADIHNGGGDIKSNDFRATAFFGKLFAERFYLDTGLQAGLATFDVKRRTALGSVNGDATGWHAGAFANLGVLLPLWVCEDDDKTNLCLMPYVGLAYSYYGVGSFDESGAETALDTDSFDANSLRASIGASLALTFPWLGKTTRVNLDFSYSRELLDTEADIESSMPGIFGGEKMKFEATAFAEDVFSIGPRISIDLDSSKSIYAGYRFDVSADSDMSHTVNIGFRSRF